MKTTPPALLLDRGTVARMLSLDDCIGALERAFAAHARGGSLAPGLLHGDGIGGEFQVVTGAAPGRREERETIVFDSTGTALQDVAAVAAVFENAVGAGLGTRFHFLGV